MSTWYQYNITAMGDEIAIGKFFGIPKEDIRIDDFEFSFGQKNGAGLRLDKLVEQHPDMIFLVEQQIECDTTNWWIERFDTLSFKRQCVHIMSHYNYNIEINKLILEEYEAKFPYLRKQHKEGRPYEWKWFFDFGTAARMLSQADKYEEMIAMLEAPDMEFDNAVPVSND